MSVVSNYEKLRRAQIADGIKQWVFPEKFLSWLYFEKYILICCILPEGGGPSLGVSMEWLLEFLKDKKNVAHFVKKDYSRKWKPFKDQIIHFWNLCCHPDLPFYLDQDEFGGIGVFCRIPNIKLLEGSLRGFLQRMDFDIYDKLDAQEYNSLIKVQKYRYAMYGPLQFVNHRCHARLSLRYCSYSKEYTIKRYLYTSDDVETFAPGTLRLRVDTQIYAEYTPNSKDLPLKKCLCVYGNHHNEN